MAKVKGICRNEDCIKCNEIQEVEKTEFVCPECGEQLIPFGGGDDGGGVIKKHGKKILLAIGAIAIIGGIAIGLSSIGDDKTGGGTGNDGGTGKGGDTEVEISKENGGSTGGMVVDDNVEPFTYEGATQNGKPHGNGTMTFNKKCVVPGSKGNIVAQPGEYAQGKWVNGEVNLVTLYQKDGNRVIITHK